MLRNTKVIRIVPDAQGKGGVKTSLHSFQMVPINDTLGGFNFHQWLGSWRKDFAASTITDPVLVTNGTFTGTLTPWWGGPNWTYFSGTALHAAGSATPLEQVVSGVIKDVRYDFTFTISGRTAGSILAVGLTSDASLVTLDDFFVVSGSLSGNGTVTGTVICRTAGVATGAHLCIVPSSTFDGAIDGVSLSLLRNPSNYTGPRVYGFHVFNKYDTSSMGLPAQSYLLTHYDGTTDGANTNYIWCHSHSIREDYTDRYVVRRAPTGIRTRFLTVKNRCFISTGDSEAQIFQGSVTSRDPLVQIQSTTYPLGIGQPSAAPTIQVISDGAAATTEYYGLGGNSYISHPQTDSALGALPGGTSLTLHLFNATTGALTADQANTTVGAAVSGTTKVSDSTGCLIGPFPVPAPRFLHYDDWDDNSPVVYIRGADWSALEILGASLWWGYGDSRHMGTIVAVAKEGSDTKITLDRQMTKPGITVNPLHPDRERQWQLFMSGVHVKLAGAITAGTVSWAPYPPNESEAINARPLMVASTALALGTETHTWLKNTVGYAYAWYDPVTGHISNISPIGFNGTDQTGARPGIPLLDRSAVTDATPGIDYPLLPDRVRFTHILFFRALYSTGGGTLFVVGGLDPKGDNWHGVTSTPPPSPAGSIVAVLGVAGGGLDPLATYQYIVVNNYATTRSSPSIATSANTDAVSFNFDLTVPVGPTGTLTRDIYRTEGGAGVFKYLTTLADNTTTAINDTAADGTLGADFVPFAPVVWIDIYPDADLLATSALRAPQFTNAKPFVTRGGRQEILLPKDMAHWDGRLWISSVQEPGGIRYSCDQVQCTFGVSEESFPATNVLRIPADDGEITAIKLIQDKLLVVTDRWAYIVVGNNETNYRLLRVSTWMPGVGVHQIAEYPAEAEDSSGAIVFLGRDRRIYMMTLGSAPVAISESIQDLLDNAVTTSQGYEDIRLHATVSNGKRLLFITTAIGNLQPNLIVLEFDLDQRIWMRSNYLVSARAFQTKFVTEIVARELAVDALDAAYPLASPPVVTLGAAGGALDAISAYGYLVVNKYSGTPSVPSLPVFIATTAAIFQTNIIVPIGPVGTTTRDIYRTEGNGTVFKYLATLADNTTMATSDAAADGTLGATLVPATGTIAIKSWWNPAATTTPVTGAVDTFPTNFDGQKTRKQIQFVKAYIAEYDLGTPSTWTLETWLDGVTQGVVSFEDFNLGSVTYPEYSQTPAGYDWDIMAVSAPNTWTVRELIVKSLGFKASNVAAWCYRANFRINFPANTNLARIYALDVGYVVQTEEGGIDP